jgi:transposase
MSRQSADYPPQLQEQAVQLYAKVRPAYTSDQAAIQAVAGVLGIDSADTLRKWICHGQLDSSSPRSGGQKPPPANQRKAARQPEKPHRRKLLWLGTLGTAGIAVLGGVLVNVLSTQTQRVVPPPSGSTAPQLEVDGVSLTSANTQVSGNGIGLNFTPYKIDIKLLNTGNGVAVINDARLIIQKFAVLPLCASQGYLGSSHTYSGDMPINPKPGQTVDVPLSQKIQPNDADRFDLLLNIPLPHGKVSGNIYLYRVHLSLAYNANIKPLDVGEVVVDLPQPPDAGEYYWDSYYAAHPQIISGFVYAPAIPEYKRCVINNSYALRSILSSPSMRPAELSAVLPQLRY